MGEREGSGEKRGQRLRGLIVMVPVAKPGDGGLFSPVPMCLQHKPFMWWLRSHSHTVCCGLDKKLSSQWLPVLKAWCPGDVLLRDDWIGRTLTLCIDEIGEPLEGGV